MNLFDVLRPQCIGVGVTPADKQAVLREIARLAKQSPVLENVSQQDILAGLEEREALGSTGFGGGIAIPHCRLEAVRDFVVGIVTCARGVAFDATDEKPVRLMVFIVAPARESNEHIRLLSAISQALIIPGAVEDILSKNTATAVQESFLRHARDEEVTKDRAGGRLFHVFVRDEELFHQILHLFAGIESSSVAVVEGENAGVHLAKIPLFAGLWRDDGARFMRIIVAVVNERMANETIRRIERVTGPLDDRDDVMVTIQQLFYTAGSLEA